MISSSVHGQDNNDVYIHYTSNWTLDYDSTFCLTYIKQWNDKDECYLNMPRLLICKFWPNWQYRTLTTPKSQVKIKTVMVIVGIPPTPPPPPTTTIILLSCFYGQIWACEDNFPYFSPSTSPKSGFSFR